jgi:hypothetical protein
MRYRKLSTALSLLIMFGFHTQCLTEAVPPKLTLAPQFKPASDKGVIYGTVFDQSGVPVRTCLEADPLDGFPGGYGFMGTCSDEHGRYRLEHLAIWGSGTRYVVTATDHKAGYSKESTGPSVDDDTNADVTLSPDRSEGKLDLHLPPKAALLHIHLTDRRTGSSISMMKVTVSAAKDKKPVKFLFSELTYSTRIVLLPPDRDLLLQVRADGYEEWNDGQPIRVPSGRDLTLDVNLEPTR